MSDRLVHLGPHVGPVLDRDANIVERRSHTFDQGSARQFVERRQMDLDHRFRLAATAFADPGPCMVAADLHNGVEHGDDVVSLRIDLTHHRIHDEGPVAADDLQHVTRQVRAVGTGRRSHTNEDVFAGATVSELPEFDSQGRKIMRADPFEILRQRVIMDL